MLRLIIILLLFSFSNCKPITDEEPSLRYTNTLAKGALLTTSFKSLEEFSRVVTIEYSSIGKPWVRLSHSSSSGKVISEMESGVSEADFISAKEDGLWAKFKLGFRSPYFVVNRRKLLKIFFLARRRHMDFGWPDIAFFDIAEKMKDNIYSDDLALATSDALSDKGYINTFNHVVAQSFMTTLFTEKLADFVADTHERKNMPELVTGNFTEDQITDIKNGVVDNYVDMINNEWGQELGKHLKRKYSINSETQWTSALLADYLNEFQRYFSSVFKLRFHPFTEKDMLTIHYANKLNRVLADVSDMW